MFVILGILLLFIYAVLGFKKPGIALITLPIVCLGPILLSEQIGSSKDVFVATFCAIAIFLITPIVVALSRPDSESSRWPQRIARLLLITFGIIALVIIDILSVAEGVQFAFLTFILTLVIIPVSVIDYRRRSPRAIAVCVLSTIGSSMRQNLPLPMALESAASGRTDRCSRTLQNIKKWLVQGYSLSESIKRGYPKCPSYALAMIASAERFDQVPAAIKAIEADMAAKANERKILEPVHAFYPVAVMSFMLFILFGLMKLVIPQFKNVLDEMFEENLPAVTQCLFAITNTVAYGIPPLSSILFGLIVLVVVLVWLRVRFRPRRPHKPYLISRIRDFITWHLPILHWFEKNRAMVQVVEILRLSLNAGCTIDAAIANTLDLDVNDRFRRRLQEWLERVKRGDNISVAAGESSLGNTLVWAFDDQVNRGNTPTILEMLESFYRLNYSYRVNLARFIMWPCVVIAMGATVGFVVYGVYSPVVAIIRHFSEVIYP
jgi:type II secretory pathway component PulF